MVCFAKSKLIAIEEMFSVWHAIVAKRAGFLCDVACGAYCKSMSVSASDIETDKAIAAPTTKKGRNFLFLA